MSRKPDAKGNEVLCRAWWEWMQGDLAAARVASDAIARLLAGSDGGDGGTVLDLSRERARRG